MSAYGQGPAPSRISGLTGAPQTSHSRPTRQSGTPSPNSAIVGSGNLDPGGTLALRSREPDFNNLCWAEAARCRSAEALFVDLYVDMVWTHVPASLALIAAAFAPTLGLSLAFLLLRALLSQMDVPVRSSYVMAVVAPAERPAAASITAVPRSLAAAASPAIAGALFAAGHGAYPLVICAILKIAYDLTLLALFHNVRPPEERHA